MSISSIIRVVSLGLTISSLEFLFLGRNSVFFFQLFLIEYPYLFGRKLGYFFQHFSPECPCLWQWGHFLLFLGLVIPLAIAISWGSLAFRRLASSISWLNSWTISISVVVVLNDWLIIATVFSYSAERLLRAYAAITLFGIGSPRVAKSSVRRFIRAR